MLTKKAFAMQPLDIIRRYKMCNSMFFVVKNQGKSCRFPIANGKFGRLHNGHESGESKPALYAVLDGEVTKVQVLSLVSETEALVCNHESWQIKDHLVNLEDLHETRSEVGSSFLKWDHTIDVPVAVTTKRMPMMRMAMMEDAGERDEDTKIMKATMRMSRGRKGRK